MRWRDAGTTALGVFLLLPFLPSAARTQNDTQSKRLQPPDLVEIVRLDSSIRLDIRYATTKNFTGKKIYSQARAYFQRPVAEALVRVHRRLQSKGYGLVILDAYRPWSVTKQFWEETDQEKRDYVANPTDGSRHNRGAAVDATLYALSTGQEVPMPSGYDEFSERASPSYTGGTSEQRKLRDLLRRSMEHQGFRVHPLEWWHFTHKDWRKYEVLDTPFEQLH